jgi:hypothetical protein
MVTRGPGTLDEEGTPVAGSLSLPLTRRKASLTRALALLGLLPLAGCEPEESIVARAAGQELTVPEVMTLLLGVRLPNDQNVTFTVAELWVDYLLLATAIADDSTAAELDLDAIVRQQVEQELLLALRDAEVKPDTLVTDEQIEQRFLQSDPGVRLRARHVFLALPQNPTQAQRDSLRSVADGLLARIRSGESFEAIARQHSNDTRTAADGGDLGWFGHGDLFGPLETAAYALSPGQVSDVVESVYGLHILRVDERQIPTLDEIRPNLRTQIQQERVAAAESVLVASVEEGADLEVVEGAPALVRRLADDPGVRLSRRARNRPLVTFRGGELTVADVVTFMQSRNTQFRIQIFQASDEAIEQNLLLGLGQRKLIAERALERGLSVSEARQDSLTQELRTRLVEAARALGLSGIPVREGEAAEDARDRRVMEILREMLSGGREVTPLGSFSFVLREHYASEVYPQGVARVMQRIAELRPDSSAAQPGAPAPAAPPPAGGPGATPPGAGPPAAATPPAPAPPP